MSTSCLATDGAFTLIIVFDRFGLREYAFTAQRHEQLVGMPGIYRWL
jgi:hypothetical protein